MTTKDRRRSRRAPPGRLRRSRPGPALCALAVILLALGCPSTAAAQEAAPTRPLRVLDVPFITQSPVLCGGAAAAMVLRYWGDPTAADTDFEHLVDPALNGIRTDALAEAMRARGLEVLEARGTIDLLAREIGAGRPPMILLAVGDGLYHFVVPVAVAEGAVILHDPARGPFQIVSERELSDRWEATDRWMAAIGRGSVVAAPRAPGHEAPGSLDAGACGAEVGGALRAVETDRADLARGLLAEARIACPDAPLVFRESAAVHFREGDWPTAARFAERAGELAPEDPHGWRILATARYMDGDPAQALAAWNRLGEPRIDLVTVPLGSKLRAPVLQRRAGIEPNDLLTPRSLALAERRLAELPAARQSRVSYTPDTAGRARVAIGVLPRQAPSLNPVWLLRTGLLALTERRVELGLPGPGGSGEYLSLDGSFGSGRRGVGLALGVPDPFGLTGVATFDALIQEETYGAAGGGTERESWRRGGVHFGRWLTADLRVTAGVGIERWGDLGTDALLSTGIERRIGRDRGRLSIGLLGAPGAGGAPSYGRIDVSGRWRSATDFAANHWLARVDWTSTSSEAPRGRWPRAGTGSIGEPLLRAHPLLVDGALQGTGFGPWLFRSTLEGRLFPWRAGPVAIGVAAFADGALVGGHAARSGSATVLDVGVGLRLTVPGLDGMFRIDGATGLEGGGGPTLSVGWQTE